MSQLQPGEIRVTAYRYASGRGLPCDLDSLLALGLAAAREGRWLGIPVLKAREGPELTVHTWPERVFDAVMCRLSLPRAGQVRDPDCDRCPGCGEPLSHGTEACADCDEDAYDRIEVIPPWCPLPRGDQALRDIGY